MDVLADSARQATLGKLSTQYDYKMKSLGYNDEASLQNSAAKNDLTGGLFSATSDMLSGAASAKYYGQPPSSAPQFYGGYNFVPGLGN
jgi:hypothetical protein